jgi:type IV secretion system protein VirB9
MKQRRLISYLLLTAVSLLLTTNAYSAEKSQSINSDRKLRSYNYQPNTVYEYTGFLKIASRIDLDPNENILSITMGDQTGWQINPVGNKIFLKPIEVDANTNMTIITDKRTYYFEMYSKEAEGLDDPDISFASSFNYPDAGENGMANPDFMDFSSEIEVKDYVPDVNENAAGVNMSYTMSGDKQISPIQVFDDGEFTYFKFKDVNADYPAIFQVLPDGNEALINFRVSRNGYVVVEMVTSQFTLRFGNQMACVFNEKSPLQRGKKKDDNTSFFGIF